MGSTPIRRNFLFCLASTPIPSTTAVPQKPSSTVVTTAVVSPTPTATPTIISEATTTLQGKGFEL